jgi:hypothetical protein
VGQTGGHRLGDEQAGATERRRPGGSLR